MRDLMHRIRTVTAIEPAVQSASVNGAALDLKGAIRGVFVVQTGAIVGAGAFGAKLQDSDDGTTFADVADPTLVDSNAPATLGASSTYKLGYRAYKRYVRLVLTKASGTSLAAGAIAVLTDLNERSSAT